MMMEKIACRCDKETIPIYGDDESVQIWGRDGSTGQGFTHTSSRQGIPPPSLHTQSCSPCAYTDTVLVDA